MIRSFGPYFVSPVIAGLEKKADGEYEPVICGNGDAGYAAVDDVMTEHQEPHEVNLCLRKTRRSE